MDNTSLSNLRDHIVHRSSYQFDKSMSGTDNVKWIAGKPDVLHQCFDGGRRGGGGGGGILVPAIPPVLILSSPGEKIQLMTRV